MFNVKWGVVSGVAAFIIALTFSLLFGKVLFLTALLRGLIFAVAFFIMGTGAWILISSFIPELLQPGGREDMADIFISREEPGSRVNITVGNTSGAALPDTGGGMSGIDEVGNISDLISGKIKPQAKDIDQLQSSGYNNSKIGNKVGEDGLADVFSASDSGSGGFSPDFSAFTGSGDFAAEAGTAEAGTAEAGTDTGAFSGSSPSSADSKAAGKDHGKTADFFGDFGAFTGGVSIDSAGGGGLAGGHAEGDKDSAGAGLGGFTGKASDSIGLFDDGDIFSSASIYSSGGADPFSEPPEDDESERRSIGNKAQEFDGDFNPKEIAAGLRTVLDRDKKG